MPLKMKKTVQQMVDRLTELPEKTRKFLNDHLRRLDRLDAKSAARKDGIG